MDKWDHVTGFCCRACMHYAPKTGKMGRCKKHAPTLDGFPVVFQDTDWCGDLKLGTNPTKEGLK